MTTPVRVELVIATETSGLRPLIEIGIDGTVFFAGESDLIQTTFVIDAEVPGDSHELYIDLIGPELVQHDPSSAVIIGAVRFQHLDNDFSIFSHYRPQYPQHWIGENRKKNIHLPMIINSNHLGWRGRWSLHFDTPIYSWMHKKLNLGWLL